MNSRALVPIIAIVLSTSLTGCAKQIADFVDKAREDDTPVPKLNLRDDAAPKISPARIESKGSSMRMEANFTTTNREIKGTSLRAKITTSRSSNN